MAAPPRPLRPKLDVDGRNVCAPEQRSLEEIPVIYFDCGIPGGRHYKHVMETRIHRAAGIAPATCCGAPVTPIDNPQNQKVDPVTKDKKVGTGGSHHIIECRFSKQKKDSTLAVQLLVNDVSGYMTAKRVRRNSVWGGWQQFTDIDDVEVPDFLNAQVVDIPGSHDNRTTIGGAGCLESMFYGLVGPVEDKKATVLALRRAIVFFCEAFRLKSLLLEIFRRLVMNERPSRLPLQSWARIGSWKVLSYFLICWGKYGKRVQAELELKLVSFGILYGLSSFEEVATELLVLRYSGDFLLTNQVKKILSHKKAGMGVKDPKFPTF